jgi:hypothetical protein
MGRPSRAIVSMISEFGWGIRTRWYISAALDVRDIPLNRLMEVIIANSFSRFIATPSM